MPDIIAASAMLLLLPMICCAYACCFFSLRCYCLLLMPYAIIAAIDAADDAAAYAGYITIATPLPLRFSPPLRAAALPLSIRCHQQWYCRQALRRPSARGVARAVVTNTTWRITGELRRCRRYADADDVSPPAAVCRAATPRAR